MAPVARDGNALLNVNGKESEILQFNSMIPQDVIVSYNSDVQKLTVTEMNLKLTLFVDIE